LKIVQAHFTKGVVAATGLPQSKPEIAVWGRSNVGKSSLINFLCQRKNLVKTSATPGKTREINYFEINNQFFVVDLPGAGYAKLNKVEQEKLENRINFYFQKSQKIHKLLYLIDFYLGGTPLDAQALSWLSQFSLPVLVVGTKVDRLSRSKWPAQTQKLMQKYQLSQPPILVSSHKAWSSEPLWDSIFSKQIAE